MSSPEDISKAAPPPPLPNRTGNGEQPARQNPSASLPQGAATGKKGSYDETVVLDQAEPTNAKERPAPQHAEANEAPKAAAPDTPDQTDDDHGNIPAPRRSWIPRRWIEGSGACLSSMVFHLAVLIMLALILVPEVIKQDILPLEVAKIEDLEEEDFDTQILDENMNPSTNQAVAFSTSSEAVDAGSMGLVAGSVPPPQIERVAKGEVFDSEFNIDSPAVHTPESRVLIQEVPEGALGDPRAIVSDYDEAMDRITRELLMLLDKRRVLVIWCFDQSVSMKDDQQEIRDRIDRVYAELGLSGRTAGGALTTAVTSYGAGFAIHTKKPTANVSEIREAISSVPVDITGKEVMCAAIGKSIATFRRVAKERQMVLILVTDETGEKEDNVMHLEAAVAEAKAAGCICYVLGREAVFGYPYAFMRWEHPGTGHIHWLRVDRGPETAFVEQLQTDGFRRRYDAFPSGFGPYEQTRLARETGGVFFMLPSLETTLVRGENRRYELEAMRGYRPDLRNRLQIGEENLNSLLRSRINQVINDLNPYNPRVQPHIELRVHFSPTFNAFLKQAAEEKAKSLRYVEYLNRAEKVFESEEMRYARQQETSRRWQANYDLLFAQILAYKVRNFEYAAYLDSFSKNPKVVPLTRAPNLTLVHWDISTRSETLTGDLTKDYIARAKGMFQAVIEDHPGTPWAARAARELRRGFGVELNPHYRAPYRSYSGPSVPIPKL